MIEKLLNSAKALIKSGNISLDSLGNFLFEFKWEILLTILLSALFNFFLLWLLRRNFKEIRTELLSALKRPGKTIDRSDFVLSISASIFFTLITYRNVLGKITSNVIGFPGDSYNHFARLKESKDLLTNPERSYYHWDTIFYPQGLSAFDGDITYFVDSVHFILSAMFNSEFIFNLIMMSSYILGFVFTYLLTRELNQKKLTSLLTAYLVTFSNFHFFASGLWINLVNFQFIPLYFLFLIKFLRKQTPVNFLITTISMVLIATSSLVYFFFTHIFIALFVLVGFSKTGAKKVLFIAVSSIISVIVISGWISKLLTAPEGLKKYFYVPHISYNLDLFYAFRLSPNQFLSEFIGHENTGGYHYLGISLFLLIIVAFVKKKSNKLLTFSFLFTLILCLGNFVKIAGTNLPIITPEIFFSFTPILKSLRVNNRYTIFLLFFSGIILGRFLFSLKNKKMLIAIILLIFIDIHPSLRANNFHSNQPPKIYKKIIKKNSPILELPLNQPIYWLWQSYHRHPVVYGYIFSRGKKEQLLYSLLENTYTGEKLNLDLIKNNKVEYIVLHKNRPESVRSVPPRILATAKPFVVKDLNQYFNETDLKKLNLIFKSKNSELYEIK